LVEAYKITSDFLKLVGSLQAHLLQQTAGSSNPLRDSVPLVRLRLTLLHLKLVEVELLHRRNITPTSLEK